MKGSRGVPWRLFQEVNGDYMTHRGWRLNASRHENVQEFEFPASFNGALERRELIAIGAALVAKLECHFMHTPGGLQLRVITCGVPDGCREHLTVSFRFQLRQIRSLGHVLEMLEKRAVTRMAIEVAYCLVFGDCGQRVSELLEAEATRHEVATVRREVERV